MFVRSNFEQPAPPNEPFQDNRTIGLAILFLGLLLCLLFSIGVDATVLDPFKATRAVTQTWQAQHPQTATPSPMPTSTIVPRDPNQQVAGKNNSERLPRG